MSSGPSREHKRKPRCPTGLWREGPGLGAVTDTHTGGDSFSFPRPTLPRDKWPFLQLGGGGHTLTPLSAMSQAIVLESTAPVASALGKEGAGARRVTCREGQPGRWCGDWRSSLMGHQGDQSAQWGSSVYFSAKHGQGPASCQQSALGLPPAMGTPRPFVQCQPHTRAGDQAKPGQARPGQVTCVLDTPPHPCDPRAPEGGAWSNSNRHWLTARSTSPSGSALLSDAVCSHFPTQRGPWLGQGPRRHLQGAGEARREGLLPAPLTGGNWRHSHVACAVPNGVGSGLRPHSRVTSR